jgi:plasmid stabilization system protein ParE
MKKNIIVSPEAKNDIAELKHYIKQELKMPETAAKYIKDLNSVIEKLPNYADSAGTNKYVQIQFGSNARHTIFKKMSIIYFVENNIIYIRRVIPSSLIY